MNHAFANYINRFDKLGHRDIKVDDFDDECIDTFLYDITLVGINYSG